MAYLPSIKMMPTALVLNAWYIVIVIVSLFAAVHISNAQAWTQDIAPTLKIKYGEFFFHSFYSHEIIPFTLCGFSRSVVIMT